MAVTRGSTILRAAGVALGVSLAVVMVAVLLIVAAIRSFLSPDWATEFEASSPVCVEISETRALVAVTLAPLNPARVMWVEVEALGARGAVLSGVATLPADAALSTLTEDDRALMEADLDDAELSIEVQDDPRVVVLRIDREPGPDAVIDKVALWFAYGEPAGVQDLPVKVSWEEDCVPAAGGSRD